MDAFIRESTCQILEFDNDLVRRLIANIKVVSADKLLIQFQSGIIMEQEISYDQENGRDGKNRIEELFLPICGKNKMLGASGVLLLAQVVSRKDIKKLILLIFYG